MGLYDKLAKSGWLGSGPQISNELDTRKSWRDYTPDATSDAMGSAIKRARKKAADQKSASTEDSGDESSG